jgi:hypothetical protein
VSAGATDPGCVNKYLAAAVSGLSYTTASFLVTHVSFGGAVTGILLFGIGVGGLIAGLATLGHAGRLESRGLPGAAFGSVVVGWTVALLVDLVTGAAFVVWLAIAWSGMHGGF